MDFKFIISMVVMLLAMVSMFFAMLWGFVFGVGCFVILVVFFTMQDGRYPVTVIVYTKRKDGYSISFDRARRMRDKKTGKAYYLLQKAGMVIKPAEFGNIIETKRGLYATLYQPSADEYVAITGIKLKPRPLAPGEAPPEGVPVEIIDGVPYIIPPLIPVSSMLDAGLKVAEEDMKFWLANSMERAYERWQKEKSKWEQYYPVISVAVLGIVMAIILWVNAQYGAAVNNQLASAANTLAQATEQLTKAFGGINIP